MVYRGLLFGLSLVSALPVGAADDLGFGEPKVLKLDWSTVLTN